MAPPPESPTTIAIRVKVPPGYLSTADNASGSDSFLVGSDVPVSATVGRLRANIEQLIPTHPAPERQRLLYGGRALVDDTQRLSDAFNVRRDPTQTEYVVHLLVKGEQGTSDGTAHRRAVSTPPTQTPRTGQPQAQQPGHPQMPMPPNFAPGVPMFNNAQHLPHHQSFPQLIARNQQMRAGMGMHGVPGQQNANGQGAQQGQQPQTDGQADANGQPQQGRQQQHAPNRPISGQGFHMQGVGPNGQRFQIHQQTMQVPMAGMPGQQFPLGFPGMPQIPGIMGQYPFGQPQNGGGPANNEGSALTRARENMAEMRRMLHEMRNRPDGARDLESQIRDLEQRTQSLNEYIDPVQTGPPQNTPNGGQVGEQIRRAMRTVPANQLPGRPRQPFPPMPRPHHHHHHVQRPSNLNEVTAYLLSSPQGPLALLFSPQYGTYTGTMANNTQPRPTPTTAITQTTNQRQRNQQPPVQGQQPQQQRQDQDPVALAAHEAVQQAQAQADAGPINAILAHFWLLLRLLIFAYFLLGSNMGWQRPFFLAVIGLGFYLFRAGFLGDGMAVRRWWEGVVGIEPADRRRAQVGQPGQQQNLHAAPQGQPGQQPARAGARGAMPTPEQVAQRLLDEQAQRQGAHQTWWREQIRPVERAVALFVASLWPGVGEATVRARREMEAETLRLQGEADAAEAERRRVEEEEREKADDGEKQPGDAGAGAKVTGEGEGDTSTPAGEKATTEGSVAASS